MARIATPYSLYFNYLCALVKVESFPGHKYFSLCRVLYDRPFVVHIRRDNNRERDGYALRKRFEEDTGVHLGDYAPDWCTFFEFLVALAFRMNDVVYDEENKYTPEYWFYELLKNLNFLKYEDDTVGSLEKYLIDATVDCVNARNFDYSGRGGLFPLLHPKGDQRRQEVAKQMSQYLFERYKHS